MIKQFENFKKYKLNKKLIWRIVILLLVTMFYMVIFISNNIRSNESEQLKEINNLLLETYGKESSLLIDNALKTANSLKYQLEEVDHITSSRIKKIVEPTLRSYDEYKGIYVLLENGRSVLNPYWYWDEGIIYSEFYDDILAVDYWSNIGNAKSRLIEPKLYDIDGKKILLTRLEVPIVKNNKTVGIVGIDLSLEYFQSLTEGLKSYEEMELSIITSEGTIVAHCQPNMVGKSIFAKDEAEKYNDIKEVMKSAVNKDNSKKIFITDFNMGQTDERWYLSVSVPKKMLTTYMNTVSYHVVFIMSVALFILIVLISITISRTLKPIKKISKAMEAAYNGDLSVRTEIHSDDEIESIGEGFNNLLEALEKNQEQLMLEIDVNESLNIELEESIKSNDRIYFETIKSLVRTIEAKDLYTGGHCDRVTNLSLDIGRAMELSNADISSLTYGAILHDIGKIGISENVISKVGRLTEEEYGEIKGHPVKGYEIVKDIHFLENARNVILQHHERYDGKGYPFGLAGEEIELNSRIVSVADAYDAMTSTRSYRDALTKESAISQLLKNKGGQFDPKVVDAFINLLSAEVDIEEIN